MTERNAQVGTKGGLSQRWREVAEHPDPPHNPNSGPVARLAGVAVMAAGKGVYAKCADALDAAKLRIEEAVKALRTYAVLYTEGVGPCVDREAVLKIIREIL